MAIAGRVAIVPKGDWSADATYKRLDAVTYNNTLYFAKKDVPAGTETSNTEYWSKSIVGSPVIVDDALSPTSTNPVQNKVIKEYVDKEVSENVDFSTSTSKILNGTVEAPLVLSNATRNLLNPTLATTTKNGITCTNNGDGTYTLNGTATAIAGFSFLSDEQRESLYKNTVGKTIKFLNGGGINPPVGRLLLNIQDGNGKWWTKGEQYDESIFTVSEGYSKIYIDLYIYKDQTVTDLIIKPMLTTDLNATYDDFVPYSGYDIKTCGKNLFKNYDHYGAYEVATETYNGNSVIYSSEDWSGAYQSDLILKKGKTYAISAYVKGSGRYFIYCDQINESGQVVDIEVEKDLNSEWTKITKIYTPNFDVHKVRLEVRSGSLYISCFQIEEGTQATDYEQYQDGGTVHIDSTTEFPLLGLKSFDGATNIISPGNVEVTYAKSDSGKAILDMSENKLDKDNVVNNQTTTVEGFALDARQANPNLDGTLAKQISDLNGSLNKLNTMVSISDCDSIDSIVEIMIKNKDKIGEGQVGNQQQTALKGVIGNIPGGKNYVDVFARYYSNFFFILFGCDRYMKNIAINFIHCIGHENYMASGWLTIIKDS